MIRKTRGRMTACCGLIIFLLAFIWGNSLLPGEVSGALSDWLKQTLQWLVPFLFKNTSDGAGGGLLRKVAHFTEFAALGTCLSWLYAMLTTKHTQQLLYAAISGVLTACVDETIQRFVPLRHGCLTDVGIDTAGVITGIVLFMIVFIINKKQHLEEMK